MFDLFSLAIKELSERWCRFIQEICSFCKHDAQKYKIKKLSVQIRQNYTFNKDPEIYSLKNIWKLNLLF